MAWRKGSSRAFLLPCEAVCSGCSAKWSSALNWSTAAVAVEELVGTGALGRRRRAMPHQRVAMMNTFIENKDLTASKYRGIFT
uniref:Uncharacterized protein n=1 Tax=Oryza brachyantha TaxID=4533 RepID=J3L9N8_ORYBR